MVLIIYGKRILLQARSDGNMPAEHEYGRRISKFTASTSLAMTCKLCFVKSSAFPSIRDFHQHLLECCYKLKRKILQQNHVKESNFNRWFPHAEND